VIKSVINMVNVQDMSHALAKCKGSSLLRALTILKGRAQGNVSCDTLEAMGSDTQTVIEK
jgi:hypothetical protein